MIDEVENFFRSFNKERRNVIIFVSDVSLDMPDEIEISHLRAKGLQPGEEELPEQQQEQPGDNFEYYVGESCCSNSLKIQRKVCSENWRDSCLYRSCIMHNYFSVFTVEVQIDEGTVAQLVDMGFHVEACKKAVFNTNNSGVEAAMNWVMEHMEDPGNQCTQFRLQRAIAHIKFFSLYSN